MIGLLQKHRGRGSMTLAEAFSIWRGSAPHAGSTIRKYGLSMRRLSSRGLGHLSDVTPKRVDEVQRCLLEVGYSPGFVRGEFSALRVLLAFLVARGSYPREHWREIREIPLPTDPPSERLHRVRFLTRAEVAELARVAREEEPRLELPILVAAYSGLRVSELARLRAENVHARLITVETLPELGEIVGSCKTGPRTVPVCRELDELLRTRLPRRGWLFPHTRGPKSHRLASPFVNSWTLRRWIREARRAANMPEDVSFRVLRHTRASWWLQGGASIYKVADWMGHEVETCEKYYGSLVDAYDPECERSPGAEDAPGVDGAP